ncbi:MAG: hypothetical protein KJ831_07875, partial [Candidatus Eisenbacteria bacterium]|nr:hypothetical protein [Candidatus Eisenbacteria bacterium]
LLRFADVLSRHVEFMTAHGVPEPVARDAVGELIYDARCQAQAANYDRAPSMARRLQIPYMNIHLPLDEIGRKRMVAVVDSLDPAATVKELLGAFEHRLPECRAAATEIELRVGLASHPIGHAAVIHAAGTNGGIPVARALYNHGVDTVIYIHCSGPDSRRLNQDFHDQGRNLIVIGHMTGDSLGINPFAEELISRGLDVTCMSGIIRNENLQIP